MSCLICANDSVISCSNNHKVCKECLQKWIKTNINQYLQIKCVECDEFYPKKDILQYFPEDTIENFFSEKQIELPKTKTEIDIIEYYKNLLDETKNMCCPNCRTVFLDFDGCVKLTCNNCGIFFCGLCINYSDNNKDNVYSHINNCEYSTEKKIYYDKGELSIIHSKLIKKRKDIILSVIKLTQTKKIYNQFVTKLPIKLSNYSYKDHCIKMLNPPQELLNVYNTGIIQKGKTKIKDWDGNTSFHYIALSGNYEALKIAIEEYHCDSVKNNDGGTIWHSLAWSGNYEALKIAIKEYHCDSVKNNNGITIWHSLACSGNYEALKIAIEEYHCDFVKSNNGVTIWHSLAYSGNYEALKIAIEEYHCDFVKSNNGVTIWHYLALSGNYEALKIAIEEYHCDSIKDNGGDNIWHYLALSGNKDAIKQSKIDFPAKKNYCIIS
jgi:ankyrin repeat protein